MIKSSDHTSALQSRLAPLLEAREYGLLYSTLQSLSHSQYRLACRILSENLLMEVSQEDFESCFISLVELNSKAFLILLSKTLAKRYGQHRFELSEAFLGRLHAIFNQIDKDKFILFLLPELQEVKHVYLLLQSMHVDEPKDKVYYLLRVHTLPTLFVLFQTLQFFDHDKDFLLKVVNFIHKKQGPYAFNMIYLIKEFFSLDSVKHTFSLRIFPYELSRISTSYKAFCEVMQF